MQPTFPSHRSQKEKKRRKPNSQRYHNGSDRSSKRRNSGRQRRPPPQQQQQQQQQQQGGLVEPLASDKEAPAPTKRPVPSRTYMVPSRATFVPSQIVETDDHYVQFMPLAKGVAVSDPGSIPSSNATDDPNHVHGSPQFPVLMTAEAPETKYDNLDVVAGGGIKTGPHNPSSPMPRNSPPPAHQSPQPSNSSQRSSRRDSSSRRKKQKKAASRIGWAGEQERRRRRY